MTSNLIVPGPAVIYGSCPSRLAHRTTDIMDFVAGFGKACLHPFNALPYEYYEGGVVGRPKTICVCCRLIEVCDEFGIFGVSEGTLTELEYHLERNDKLETPQPLYVFIRDFDPDWQEYYVRFINQFPRGLSALKLHLFGS